MPQLAGLFDQHAGGSELMLLGIDRAACGLAKLAEIGGEEIRAGIAPVASSLRIDHHRLARALGSLDDPADRLVGQQPLAVVGEQDRIDVGHEIGGGADQSVLKLGRDRRGVLDIGAQEMCVVEVGDEAAFERRDALRRVDEVRLDIRQLAETAADRMGRLVGAHHPQEIALSAQRGDIPRHVAGAADRLLDPVQVDDRRRRLGRNPPDAAVAEAVQHEVADHQDPPG